MKYSTNQNFFSIKGYGQNFHIEKRFEKWRNLDCPYIRV